MQAFIDNASRSLVENGATFIKTIEVPLGRLIDPNHPLLGNDLDSVVQNHHNSIRILTSNEFSTFLASSSLSHSLDGWIYLAHSIESLLKGDKGLSVHLAYYAELRASMSFLASQGIAVLNNHHLNIDSSGLITKFQNRIGTHSFAWKVLNHYILSTAKSNNHILNIFRFYGKTFSEWFNAIPNSSGLMADEIVKDWLKEWSFDINLFNSDRNLRNEVSYRPRKLNDNYLLNLDETLDKLSSYWNLLEPKNIERFALLDQYLLKKLFKKAHLLIQNALGRVIDFNALLDSTFSMLNLPLSAQHRIFFNSLNDHPLFVSASNTPTLANTIDPLTTIARALLLLRLTIGYSSSTLVNAGITKNEMHGLFDNIGINNGFWNKTTIPQDFISLWSEDMASSIIEIENWRRGRSIPGSFLEINSELSNELVYYKQINRASFWGINF